MGALGLTHRSRGAAQKAAQPAELRR
jgi:hypothetical protein